MKDTRETLTWNLNIERVPANNEFGEDIEIRPSCRFKVGDRLCHPNGAEFVLRTEPFWDYEFGGWLIAPNMIGIHESNFILACERNAWEPHEGGLWSYWVRKEAENDEEKDR